jgi:hypothetical protein
MHLQLLNKVFVLSGGAIGIGLGIAESFKNAYTKVWTQRRV